MISNPVSRVYLHSYFLSCRLYKWLSFWPKIAKTWNVNRQHYKNYHELLLNYSNVVSLRVKKFQLTLQLRFWKILVKQRLILHYFLCKISEKQKIVPHFQVLRSQTFWRLTTRIMPSHSPYILGKMGGEKPTVHK